jgi:hypothetical protein
MAIRNSLATLIVTLLVGLAPIPALAVGIGGATATVFFSDIMLTFSDDSTFGEDIVEIVLYGTAAAESVTWGNLSFGKDDPPGANSSFAGENSPIVTIDFTDVAGPNPGFNPGEVFSIFPAFACVFCEDADPGNDRPATLADLIGVEVRFTFEDTSTTHGVFQPDDPGNPGAGLTLLMVPEPRTAILLALGLFGLATTGRRLA